MNFDLPTSIEDMSVRMATLDIDFLDGDKIVLPSRQGMTFSSPQWIQNWQKKLAFRYLQKIDLNPEWKQFLKKSVDTIRIHFHVDFEKGWANIISYAYI